MPTHQTLRGPNSALGTDSFDDPEKSYRRGYEHGAWHLFEFVKSDLSSAKRAEALDWIQRDIRNWRVANLRGETARRNGFADVSIVPPPAPHLRRKTGR